MSNSSLATYTLISPHKTSPRTRKIDTITIHCVVGQCTIQALGAEFAKPTKKASSNYGVDKDGTIGLFAEEKDRAWTSGGKDLNGNPILVNGISGSENDHRAVTIEVASDTKPPYAVTEKAYKALIDLCIDICKRNNIKELKWKGDKTLVGKITEQNMTVHRWFANKDCPGDYLYSRHGEIARLVNQKLNPPAVTQPKPPQPVTIPKLEVTDMTVQEFEALWKEMRKKLQDNDSATWSKEARDWAIKKGLVQGGSSGAANYMWEDVLTREQLVMMFYRFAKIIGQA